MVNGDPVAIAFDAEGVDVQFNPISGLADIEAFSPDYEGHFMLDGQGNPIHVLFTDVPCVKRWNRLDVTDNSDVGVLDVACSSPISGACTGGPALNGGVFEAVYVVDLIVGVGAVLDVKNLNLYYTGSVDVDGTLESINSPYTAIQLTPTIYGNFDGDAVTFSSDADDVSFFNEHFPSDIVDLETCTEGVDCYNPLVDADCDGDVDCDDRNAFLGNFPSSIGVELGTCGT